MRPPRALILFAIAIFVAWATTPLIVEGFFAERRDAAGQFGDIFGSINSLFSGFAFVALVWTFIWQQKHADQNTRIAAISAQLAALPMLIEAQRAAVAEVEEAAELPKRSRAWGNAALADEGIAQLVIELRECGTAIEKLTAEVAEQDPTDLPFPNDPRINLRREERKSEDLTTLISRAGLLQKYLADLEDAYAVLARLRKKSGE